MSISFDSGKGEPVRARAYGFLTACVVLFVSTSVWSQDKKDDQPGTLTVHIRDYCDPASFAAIGCTRAVTPVTSGIITFSGFQAELTADKSVGPGVLFPIAPTHRKASNSCCRTSEARLTRLRESRNSGVDLFRR